MQTTNVSRRTVLAGGAALAATSALPATPALAAVMPRAWAFEIGQMVDHEEATPEWGMVSIVLSRHWTGKREVYGVRAVSLDDPVRDRMMSGEVLVAV